MNILIVVDFGFPFGSGATSRAYSYAQGLRDNGARVKVLCVEPSDSRDTEPPRPPRGEYRGIDYAYTYGRTSRPRSRLARGVLKLAKWWLFFWAVLAWARELGGVDAMILYSRSVPWAAAARLASRAVTAPLIHEDCELPFVWSADTPRNRARRWAYEHIAFRWFDACLVISTFLQDYCARHLRAGARTLLVPLLVDVEEVEPLEPDEALEDVLAFCGSLDHPEVRGLLEAFAAMTDEFPQVKLRLIGGAKRAASREALLRLAEHLRILEQLELIGTVRREELFAHLRSARALVLPRPSGAFSRAGMPTKVGEYLATGRPVVLTANGDLPLYLEDGVDAYLVPPDDVSAFAGRLRDVLRDPEAASEVGRRGRETARARFDSTAHGARIIAFIAELQSRGRVGSATAAAAGGQGSP